LDDLTIEEHLLIFKEEELQNCSVLNGVRISRKTTLRWRCQANCGESDNDNGKWH